MYKSLLLLLFSVLSIGMHAQVSADSMIHMFHLSPDQTQRLKEVMQSFQTSKEEVAAKPDLTFDQRESLYKEAQHHAEEQLMNIFHLDQKMLYLDVLSKNGVLNTSALNLRKTDILSVYLKDTLHLDHDQTTATYAAIKMYLDARSDLKKNPEVNAKKFAKADAVAYKQMLNKVSALLEEAQKKQFLSLAKRKKGASDNLIP